MESPKVATLLIFLLGPNTIQKQPRGLEDFLWFRFSEVSAHLWSFVYVLLGPVVRLNIKAKECVEEKIGYVMAHRNQTEEGTIHNFRRHTSNDLLPPVSPYFLKLPELNQIAPAVGFKHSTHKPVEASSQSNHNSFVGSQLLICSREDGSLPKYGLTHLP